MRRRVHLGAQCTQGWGCGGARAGSLWRGQGSRCWPWGNPGTRGRAQGPGAEGRRPGVHRGIRYTQVEGTGEGRAGATGSQHLMCLGGRGRGQTGCGEGVRRPGEHPGVQCTRLGGYREAHGELIHSQRHEGLGRRETGHIANSEEAKRLGGHPGAQCTQHMEAGRTRKRSGMPLG